MFSVGVVNVALGVLFGLVSRLVFFVLMVLLTVAAFAVVMIASGEDRILLRAMIAVIALQVGYVVGIAARAVMQRGATRPVATPQNERHHSQPIGRPGSQ